MRSSLRVRLFALVLTSLYVAAGCQSRESLPIPPDAEARSDSGRTTNPAYTASIDTSRARLQTLRATRHYPALSVAVSVGREMVWADAWGWANIEHRTAATTASRFPVASISKPIAAAVVMRLAERGVLDLDHDVREYVPSFPKKAYPITSRQLLSHQAGIRYYRRIRTRPWLTENYLNRDFPDLTSALTLFADDRLLFEPDAGFAYSTFGYTLLGAVVEGAMGKRFIDVLHDELLVPSHMPSTGPDSSMTITDRTRDYQQAKPPGSVRASPRVNSSYKWSGGGLVSTPTDLVRFGAALLAGDIVSADARKAMFTPRTLRGGAENPQRYGLGWRAASVPDPADSTRTLSVVYHGGSGIGAEAALVLVPAAGVAVAISGNAATGGDGAMVEVAIAIARTFMRVNR